MGKGCAYHGETERRVRTTPCGSDTTAGAPSAGMKVTQRRWSTLAPSEMLR